LGQLEYIITHSKEKTPCPTFLQEIKDYLYKKENGIESSSEDSRSSENDDKKGEENIHKVNRIRQPRSLAVGTKRSRADGQNDGAAQD
jgi:hypothetical protein